MSGIAAVHARISEIDAMLKSLAPPPRPTAAGVSLAGAPAGATSAGTTSAGSAFDAVLAGLVSQASGAAASAPASASASASNEPTGKDLVDAAREYLGVPYKWGGTDPATGLDCSALVQRALRDLGVEVPRTVRDQRHVGTEVPSLAQAKPGDLIVLGGDRHIGIYVGDNKFLHAPRTGDVVKIAKVYETPTSIRRVLPDVAEQAPTGPPVMSALAARPAALRTPSGVAAYSDLFAAATQQYGLPGGLLAAVAQAESGGNPNAVSPAGAVGLMQLMPGTARDLGVADSRDPAQAVDGAARLLRDHLKTFGSIDLALAAYNAGPGNVRKYDGIPPFAETQGYVRKVTDMLASGVAA